MPDTTQNKTLEVTCYVAGAGAFGVFLRWLQVQLAFNEAGLAEKSLFHLFVLLYIAAIGFAFLHFIDRERSRNAALPDDYGEAMYTPDPVRLTKMLPSGEIHLKKVYVFCRWAAGAVICLGGLLLYAASETDEQVTLLRVLAGLSVVFGLSYPALIGSAGKVARRRWLWCAAACEPVLLFAFWLVLSYKTNAINSVVWAYAVEMAAIVAAMAAFFRLAGFLFDSPSGWRSMFFSMMGAALCIMALADERYLGMQLIFFGTAALLLLCNWHLFINLRYVEAPPKEEPDDGFERLGYVPPQVKDESRPAKKNAKRRRM